MEVSVYVCKTATDAAAAKAFLVASGYAAHNIEIIQTQNVIYDGSKYNGGGKTDLPAEPNFVVFGRS